MKNSGKSTIVERQGLSLNFKLTHQIDNSHWAPGTLSLPLPCAKTAETAMCLVLHGGPLHQNPVPDAFKVGTLLILWILTQSQQTIQGLSS